MRRYSPRWTMLVVASVIMAFPGCGSGDRPDKSNGTPVAKQKGTNVGEKGRNTKQEDTGVGETRPELGTEPNIKPPATIPPVNLLEKDRNACIVFVGDAMPQTELPDQDGNTHALTGLYGEKATVVCFWTNGEPPYGPLSATALLEDLEKDCAQPYAEKGLKVVGVNEGDTAEIVSKQVEQAGVTFSMLLDSEGAYFKKEVAKEKLPRLYVLDAEGKILWLDIEYSGPTREQLDQAVRAALEEN